MKKSISDSLLSAIYDALIVALLFLFMGWNPMVGAAVGVLLGIGYGFVSPKHQAPILRAGLLKEVWIAQIMEKFYSASTFLNYADDMSDQVENNVINLTDAGVDPAVLINNTAYPVGIQERADTPLALPLDYYDTVNTVVRSAVEKQRGAKQMESVVAGHRNQLREKCAAKAAHNFTPTATGAYTPVLDSTGAARPDGTKRFSLADLAQAEFVCNDLKIPVEDRIFVLSPQHKLDLTIQDQNLQKIFANLQTGQILNLYNFTILMTQLTPKFNPATKTKRAFGAAAVAGDVNSSFFYHKNEVVKADGTMDMFSRLKDPEARGDIIGFQKFFMALPKRNKNFGAIIG